MAKKKLKKKEMISSGGSPPDAQRTIVAEVQNLSTQIKNNHRAKLLITTK